MSPTTRSGTRSAIRSAICSSILLAGLLPAPAAAQRCPMRPKWPTAGWVVRTAETELARAAQVRALEDFAFTLTGTDEERRGTRTDAVVIVQDGSVLWERYARGYGPETRHYTWSVSKTVTNALTGIAVARGALALADSVCKHVELPRQDHCDLRVQDLLEFASGLAWTETYEDKSNQDSSVLAMLYGVGRKDMMRFVASHDSRDPPGATYMYSSGDATFLAGVVDAAMRRTLPRDWPFSLLFDPLGMASATFERDAAGTPVGSSWFYATPRDLAKFGFLLLSDGCWEAERILPEGWVADSTAVSAPFRKRPLDNEPDDVQGRQIWLNRAVPEQDVKKPWPDVPDDAYAARGHWGQSITVIPSRDLVVVRLADDRQPGFDFNKFLSLAMAVAQ